MLLTIIIKELFFLTLVLHDFFFRSRDQTNVNFNNKNYVFVFKGVFMVLAWMFFAPVGIFTAKFFRTNKAICGQKLWFQVSSNHIILFKEKLVLGLGLGFGGKV